MDTTSKIKKRLDCPWFLPLNAKELNINIIELYQILNQKVKIVRLKFYLLSNNDKKYLTL